MHSIIGLRLIGGKVAWQVHDDHGEDGLAITFTLSGGGFDNREAIRVVKQMIEENDIAWIRPSQVIWRLDIDALKKWYKALHGTDFLGGLNWLNGVVNIEPTVKLHPGIAHIDFATTAATTTVHLYVYREKYEVTKARKLFLSHKGANKPLVRQYCHVLRTLGFVPWLDEHAMPAGTKLHRGIQEGIQESCAAIFFITPEFSDESHLAKEIDYAVEEERKRGARFKIVTLVFMDSGGNKGVVPELLKPFVWKEPTTDLEALWEILKAIPLEVGPIDWRPGV